MVVQVLSCSNPYTSCAVNNSPHCLDIKHQLLCFGTANSIALYDFETRKVVWLCSHHLDIVTSVRWIGFEDSHFISSSADKSCIIWRKSSNHRHRYEVQFILSGHSDSVIVSDSLLHRSSDDDVSFLSVSVANDQLVNVWQNDQLVCSKKLHSFVFDVKLYDHLIIPGVIVITTGSDESLHINRYNFEHRQLECLISLKGHGDWIRSIDLYQVDKEFIMLASGSKDFLIRVYNISPLSDKVSLHEQEFTVTESNGTKSMFVVNLETVLAGHEGWVTDVKWHYSDKLYLLSSSMDKTILLWEQMDRNSESVWNEKVRFGEVGDNVTGFIGCCSMASQQHILGYSFNGSINQWRLEQQSQQWTVSYSITGHFNEVTDLVWEPQGEYFITCSADQTTRLHCYWSQDAITSWHEICRPQIHGYDLKCLAMVDRLRLVSGADEKVIRVFEATKYFVDSLRQINGLEADASLTADGGDQALVECATVPSLGLSNSAVYNSGQLNEEFKPKPLRTPPTEEILQQHTLWHETQKLYGHGYEIFSIAVNQSGTLLASACKAATATHAAAILWDLKSFKKLAQLSSHNLTITKLRFSFDERFLLSVSRDRTWALFDMTTSDYCRRAFSDKKTGKHSRIIWDCAWTPDSAAFLTASRDKTVVIWLLTSNQTNSLQVTSVEQMLKLDDSITSVDVHKQCFNGQYLACLALETGQFYLYSFNLSGQWSLLYNFSDYKHTHTIPTVRFSSKTQCEDDSNHQSIYLATCSVDRTVKLFQVTLDLVS